MSDDAPSSPVTIGENPEDLVFGVGAVDGKVVMRFDKLIQWFDMEPALAVELAEKLIDSAKEAMRGRIVKPQPQPRKLVQ